jgi:hypothetical protein
MLRIVFKVYIAKSKRLVDLTCTNVKNIVSKLTMRFWMVQNCGKIERLQQQQQQMITSAVE